ncbi:MAG: DUF1015 family protein [Acidobacteriota bacterium]|nr:DUF1015 family protein [Acidobacteriota bacterium]MDE3264728.1 DUF1015 family protein [Acidobacteriota bacterium]
MKLYAFQGYRYNSAVVDAAAQAAPPFDQIDETLRDRLHAQSPHQFARVTKPAGDEGKTPHERSAALHREWLERGVVTRDETPSVYPYAITQPDGSSRLGLCALVGVEPGREADLWPHEQTVAKSIAERLDLLRLTRIDIEPVFYLAEDDGTLERLLTEDCGGGAGEALVSHTDPWTGDVHALYRLTDTERIAAYAGALAGARAAIADGHHRTQVAQTYAAEEGAAGGTAAACKMVVLTSLASANLRIDPVHRGVRVPVDREAMSTLPLVREPLEAIEGQEIAARVAAAPQPALAVWFQGDEAPELWTLDPDAAPADTPGRKANLPAVLLHHHLLKTTGVPIESATDGSIAYEADPDEIVALLKNSEITAGVFLPPMTPKQFALATEDGDLLPPKSTRFLPKLVSGLVWCGHDAMIVAGDPQQT